jgi:surface protein
MTIKWGDGTPDISYRPGPQIRHTYSGAGTYIVQISGRTALGFGSSKAYTGADLITDVLQWGYIGTSSFSGAFNGASNLVSVPTTFVPGVTNTSAMFRYAYLFNSNISNWDVSNVTNMSEMFANARAFNQPLNSWNVSSVKYMNAMFNGAISFNQPLYSWRPNSVTDMRGMFYSATAFNQPLNSWSSSVSKVTDMASMFTLATAFNQPLDSWSTKLGKVTNMSSMFASATSFNQNLSSWIAPRVTDAYTMFCRCPVYGKLEWYPQFSGTPIGYPLYGCN